MSLDGGLSMSLEDLPGWLQDISSMCPPESFAGLASGILFSGCAPTLSLNSTSAPQGWKASSASQGVGWDTHGSWGTRGAPWLSPGQRSQCWEKDWVQLWLLGVQGLHKRLYSTPLPGVWALLQFWLQNRKLQKPSKNIVWSFIWNKAMLQGQVQL